MLVKIKHLFQRFLVCSKDFPGSCREFGIKIAALKFWDVLFPVGKSKTYINALSAYMIRQLAPLTEKFTNEKISVPSPKKKLEKIPVWVCWWQGEDNMPPIVRACVSKLRRSLPETAQLHLITWDNVSEYVDLPEHILEKHQKGIIGPAHLSDVLRFGLLSNYGGAWIDSTVYLSGGIPERMLTDSFFTQRFESWDACPQEACRGKWCGFFLGGRADNVLFAFMYDALCFWWSRHERVVDYVFFDYILWAGYCEIAQIRQQIDGVPANNENIWLLEKWLNEPYTDSVPEEVFAKNEFFKLSYKGRLALATADGRKTVYAKILEENNVI